jgi:flagellar basal-body rod protein FlgC
MDLFSAMDISATGLITQRYRMNVASENLANIDSTRTANGSPYRRKQVILEAAGNYYEPFPQLMGKLNGARVSAIVEDQTPFREVNRPGHPDADQNGNVLMPNVNAVLEMADILSATRAYEANVNAFTAVKSMITKSWELSR